MDKLHSIPIQYAPFSAARILPAATVPPFSRPGRQNPAEVCIEAQALSLDDHEQTICRDLHFHICQGSISALVTRDRACKKALFNHLAGRKRPKAGRCLIKGAMACNLPLTVKSRLGVLADEDRAYEVMTLGQIAVFFCGCSADWRQETYFRLVNEIGLSKKCKLSNLDRNQRSLVALAVLLAGNPDILILDDYFTGLDTGTIKLIFHEIQKFNRDSRKTTVIVSDHAGSLPYLVDTLIFVGQSTSVRIGAAEVIGSNPALVLRRGLEPVLIPPSRFSNFTLRDQPAALRPAPGQPKHFPGGAPPPIDRSLSPWPYSCRENLESHYFIRNS